MSLCPQLLLLRLQGTRRAVVVVGAAVLLLATVVILDYTANSSTGTPKMQPLADVVPTRMQPQADAIPTVQSSEVLPESAGDPDCLKAYRELRGVNLQHPALASRLCEGHPAYRLVDGKYPACQLGSRLPQELLQPIRDSATKSYLVSQLTGHNVSIYTYSAADYISDFVHRTHSWEGELVRQTLSIAQIFPAGSVTFVDIGCNIGVYSLQAREAGIPTVAVDANLRNLLRVRLATTDMGWPASDEKLRLLWTFYHGTVSFQRLGFLANACNIGAAGQVGEGSIVDTIPVMTGTADDLLDSIGTRLVVMKMDIESSEHVFLSNASRLFRERSIIAVQTEWLHQDRFRPGLKQVERFFTGHGYKLLTMDFAPVTNVEDFHDQEGLWVRQDFLGVVTSMAAKRRRRR